MNFLAHVQLSHCIAPVITGNLVADSYKGSKHLDLGHGIHHGVILHRKIDSFTDNNQGVLAMKRLLAAYFGRYSGVALDVYFDHFLSKHWLQFNKLGLNEEIELIHADLIEFFGAINHESKQFLERLIQYGWLKAYLELPNLERIFIQMSHRFKVDVLKNSMLPLEKHYLEIEATFLNLYPLLVAESKTYLNGVGLSTINHERLKK
jgi:acyl carrier protein phosphodiesterase